MNELFLIRDIIIALVAFEILKVFIVELITSVVRNKMVSRAQEQMRTILTMQKEVNDGNRSIEEAVLRETEIHNKINYDPNEFVDETADFEEPMSPLKLKKKKSVVH